MCILPPHIGLATITWLFDGALTNPDSLGTAIDIAPGAVNWMTAGRDITHSERTPHRERAAGHSLHGLQAWVALPCSHEETAPAFQHIATEDLPVMEAASARLTLIAGDHGGVRSPAASRPCRVTMNSSPIEPRSPAAKVLAMTVHLTPDFAVSPQIAPEDVAALAAAGFTTIINNRPEQEAPDQPEGAAIEAAAIAAGLGYAAIPVGPAGIGPDEVEALAAALASAPGPVFAFCRSGTRSTHLWAFARARAGDAPDALIEAAAGAGYDISGLAGILRQIGPRQP